MKFLMISTPNAEQANTPPSPDFLAQMSKFIAEQKQAGTLLLTGGLMPASMGGAKVKSLDGEFTVVDGPFTETKELVAGFAIIEVGSREEAIEASRKFFKIAGDGEGEIRPIMEG